MKQFLQNDDGSVTVETVIWLPIFFTIIGLVVDATLLFVGQTQMWSVASDTSRLVAMGRLTVAEAEIWAEDSAAEGVVFVVDIITDANSVTTTITRSFDSIGMIGSLFNVAGDLGVSARYRLEPAI
jgi:TadE-like protein